jgi:hypothetical protein
MYQKKQATAQQAEAVVDALMKVFGSLRYSLRSFQAATRIDSPGIGFRKCLICVPPSSNGDVLKPDAKHKTV